MDGKLNLVSEKVVPMNICGVKRNAKYCGYCPYVRSHAPSAACARGHFRGCPPCKAHVQHGRKNAWGFCGVFTRRVLPGDPDYKAKIAAIKAARQLYADVVEGIDL